MYGRRPVKSIPYTSDKYKDVMSTQSPSGGGDRPDIARDVVEATPPRLPAHLAPLADRARDYIKAASAENTRRAYGADWRHTPPGAG